MSNYKRSDMRNTIDEYVINSMYRDVLKLRYCDGMTYEKIAEMCNYSTQSVKRICTSYRDVLFSHL